VCSAFFLQQQISSIAVPFSASLIRKDAWLQAAGGEAEKAKTGTDAAI